MRRAFIDVTGVGGSVYDRLRQLGYDDLVVGINFGNEPTDKHAYGGARPEGYIVDPGLADYARLLDAEFGGVLRVSGRPIDGSTLEQGGAKRSSTMSHPITGGAARRRKRSRCRSRTAGPMSGSRPRVLWARLKSNT